MNAFFAYKNKWGRVIVKPHDMADVIEALNSPSVVGIIRHLKADSLDHAEHLAKLVFQDGIFETTFGGAQS